MRFTQLKHWNSDERTRRVALATSLEFRETTGPRLRDHAACLLLAEGVHAT